MPSEKHLKKKQKQKKTTNIFIKRDKKLNHEIWNRIDVWHFYFLFFFYGSDF